MIKSITKWLITIIICVAAASALAYWKYTDISQQIAAAESMPEHFETVETATASSVEYTPTIRALGKALAPRQVTLRNELSGYISEVHFPSGGRVEKGQIILKLDTSQQEALLASAQARAKLAELQFDRREALSKSNSVSKEEVDRAQAEVDVVNADIDSIKSIIERRTLRAPFSGLVGLHQFEVGQFLDVNTVITTLVGDSESVWIDFSVPQFYGELSKGTKVKVSVVRASNNNPKDQAIAEIIASNSSISEGARARIYRAELKNRHASLLHNASIEVEVPVGEARSLIAVPSTALQYNVEGAFVFTLEDEPERDAFFRAHSVPVQIEHEGNDLVYLSSTVTPQTRIAAAGAFKLRDGSLARAGQRPAKPSVH